MPDLRWPVVRLLALVAASGLLTACVSDSTSSDESDAPATTARNAPATTVAATNGLGCPFSADALSGATALRWELKERRENHAIETAESVMATVCVFTTADAPQEGGDPLVLRTDVVAFPEAEAEARRFSSTCRESGGQPLPSGGGSVCAREGVVVEGIKGVGDGLVSVYLVNADPPTAALLTPAFGGILADIR